MNSVRQIAEVSRSVTNCMKAGKPAHAIELTQTFATSQADLWVAVSTPDRLSRWFALVSGDLQLNCRFHIQDNASGTITYCDAPHGYATTWEIDDEISWLEVRIREVDHVHAELTISHISHHDSHWETYGPGAGGIGWDLSLLGLHEFLESGTDIPMEQSEWGNSTEAIEFMTASGKSWIDGDIVAGHVSDDAIRRGKSTITFYTGAKETE